MQDKEWLRGREKEGRRLGKNREEVLWQQLGAIRVLSIFCPCFGNRKVSYFILLIDVCIVLYLLCELCKDTLFF